MKSTAIASVGFHNGQRFFTLGVITEPENGGYYLAVSTAGGDMYQGGNVLGGYRNPADAAKRILERWGKPA